MKATNKMGYQAVLRFLPIWIPFIFISDLWDTRMYLNIYSLCVCVYIFWCDKHQKQCKEERAYFILEVTVNHHSEIHGRNLEAECGTESTEDHCSLACFVHLLSSDTLSHPLLQIVLSTVGWGLLHQLVIKEMLNRPAQRSSDRGNL